MKDCIFCKIINGDIPSYKIYEDATVLAFLDINPDCNGHTLVIPKAHYKDLTDIDLNTINSIFNASKILIEQLKPKLNCDGFTLVQNNGDIQEVKHFHLHIKPYYNKKNKVLKADETYKMLND